MEDTVQRYNAATRKLEQPVSSKTEKILAQGLVKRIVVGLYEVLPIPGYNITTYTIRESYGQLSCNCQGFHKNHRCAHVDAIRIFRERTETREEQLQAHLPL